MNNNNEALAVKEKGNGYELGRARTTIGLKTTTKSKLDANRAPGQCYDGFICQLVDLWERANGNRMASMVNTVGGNQGVIGTPS